MTAHNTNELTDPTIKELAYKYAEAMIAQRRIVVALTQTGDASEEQVRQLRELEYDTWAILCEAQSQLSKGVHRYVDSEQG